LSPLRFRIASFFIGGLCFLATCILGLLLFHRRYLFLSQGAKFVIMCLRSWLWLAERNSYLSNMELALLVISTMVINILGNEAYIIASTLRGLRLVKNLTPSWASPVRKRVRSLGMNANIRV
jgi:hypothetical protein